MVFWGVGGPLSLQKVPPDCTPWWCHKKRPRPPPVGRGDHCRFFLFNRKTKLKNPEIFFSGLRPKNKGVQKLEKMSFFGIKNVKNFKSGIQFFFSQKIFNPPTRPKRHFALKDTFPIKQKTRKNFQNFQNFC